MFSDYYLPSTEYGQRHFGIYSGIADRAMERGYALIPYRLPPPEASRQEIAASVEELVRNYAGVIHLGGRQYDVDPPLAGLVVIGLGCAPKQFGQKGIIYHYIQKSRL